MSAWKCSCGRIVPAQVEKCRCGRARQRTGLASPAPPKVGARSALLVAGTALVAVALAFGAYALYRVSTSPGIRVEPPATQPLAPVSPPVAEAASPQPSAGPAQLAVASPALPAAWLALQASPEPAATVAAAEGRFPTPPPLAVQGTNETPPAQGPSETEILQEKIQRYRAEYGTARSRVESLEREVAELTELATKVFAEGNSAAATIDADVVRSRLDRARHDLKNARDALAAVEERARRDGVSYGQLY